jgi:very-short-patch-repair endonuclease
MPAIKNSWSGWGEAGRIASYHFGLVTIDQLRGVGLADSVIADAVARGRLHRVFHGVYSVGHRHLDPRARLLAATLACGPGSVVSHGIRRRFVPPPGKGEVWIRSGVPVTNAARTIVDFAEPWRWYRRGIKIRSRMEAKLLPLLTEAGLPIPRTNQQIRIDQEVFEVDFLWAREKLVVETDGGAFHDNPAAGDRDSHRPDQTLTEIAHLLAR